VSSYPVSSAVAMSPVQIPGMDLLGMGLGMVAVPVAALAWPVRDAGRSGSRRWRGDDRSGLVVTGAQAIRMGDRVLWCKVVAVTAAVVRRDGRVQAQGRPCDHARLGAAEVELDTRCGPGAIERVAAGVRPAGKIKGKARREMSVAFTIRAVLLMTLMPDADARRVLATLLGDLIGVPWQRAHTVPSPTVLSTWRTAIGPVGVQQLQRELLAAVAVEHRDGAAGRVGIEVGGGLRVGAIDGTVTRMPDTKANRTQFGTAGASGDGFPQIRHLHASDAYTRATLAAVTGPAGGDKAEAEQALLDRMLAEHEHLFTPDRLWIMDRNFPGVSRIARMLATTTHVLIRVKSDIRLDRISDFLPDGSYLARLSGGGATLTVRVIEYHVSIEQTTTAELFCLVTDLLDHDTHPARLLAGAYQWRWDGSETALREAKSTLAGAGPGLGAFLRSASPALIQQEHAAWITASELVHATTRTAASRSAAFTKGPRTGQPVHARHLSFTAARHTLITSVRAGTATASLPATTRTAAYRAVLDLIATARVTTDRHRHRPHKIKSGQAFGHAPRDITTRIAPAAVHVCGTATTPAA